MLIGVVGKANVGKSTFFKAATLSDVLIANYPFATIKPNTGVAYVEVECVDKEFQTQCNPREGVCTNHKRFVPIPLIDVAGLVPGAHEGKGLGLQFLSDLNQADALIHVVDCAGATNEKGEPVNPGTYDPLNDVKFLEQELDYWYLNILNKGWEKLARTVSAEKQDVVKALAKQLSGLGVTEEMIKQAMKNYPEDPTKWNKDQLLQLAAHLRKKSKPMIIAANKIDVPGAKENLQRLQQQCKEHIIIPCSGDAELALKEAAKKGLLDYLPGASTFTMKGNLSEQQKQALTYIQKNVLDVWGSTGVQKILDTIIFGVLKRVAIFPGGLNKLSDQYGNILPDCFLLPAGATALDFAFRLHTDIGNNFIKAINVKTKKIVGKEYQIQHRDVMEIVIKK